MRQATKADLDDIADVIAAAFPDDPGCDYKFPYRDKYPEDFRKWLRIEYEGYLDQPKKFAFNVVTVTEGDLVDKAIAVGVWDISVHTPANGGGAHAFVAFSIFPNLNAL